jgi:hypothetical protein
MSLAETDEDDTSASEGLGGCFLDNQLPGTCPLKKRHKWDEVASAGRHVAASRRDAPEPTAPKHPSPPPPSETHRAADDEDTRRGREDRDRDPSPATRRLERDFAVAEEGELKGGARLFFAQAGEPPSPIGPRRRRATPRRDSRFASALVAAAFIPAALVAAAFIPAALVAAVFIPCRPRSPRGVARATRSKSTAVSRWTGTFPAPGIAGFATPASSDAGFPFHGAFCVRTARQLNEICKNPGAFKGKLCKELRRDRFVRARAHVLARTPRAPAEAPRRGLGRAARKQKGTRTVRSRVIRFARTCI